MKSTIRFRSLLLAAFGLASALRADVHVSPSGDDAAAGTRESPVRTLEKAKALARAQSASGADVTVWLDGGVYRLSAPLEFTAEDSGRAGHPVAWRALPGREPVVSGGLAVTGWKRVDAARNLWAAPAPAGLGNTRQLFVNGVRAERARGRSPVALKETATGYTASAPTLAGWRNPSDIEFVYTGGNALWSEKSVGLGPWTEPRCPVASISGAEIVMAQPCWDNSTKRVMLPPEAGFKRTANLVGPASIGKEPAYLENAYELLGTPGQWYFDRAAGAIYYVPRAGEDLASADVEAPALERLVVGAGTPERPVHDLLFSGLDFAYATWLFPSTGQGFSEIQANIMVTGERGWAVQGLGSFVPGGLRPFGAWTPIPGNVDFAYARGVAFENDAFVHLGAAGLRFGNGSQGNSVHDCLFTDVSGNGCELGGVDLPEAGDDAVTRDNRIENNRFTDIAAEYHGGVAILVGYAQRTRVAHNQIDHVPYSGISMGWGGWPDKIHQPGVANNSRENVVEDNLIFSHMLLLADGGGIYTQGLTGPDLASGERVRGNVVRDQFSTGHAIYSDNGSCNMTVSGNVMYRTNFDNWGSRHANYYHGGDGSTYDPITVEGNWWQQGNADSAEKNITLKDNHLIASLDDVPPAVLAAAGLEPGHRGLLARSFAPEAAPASPSRVAALAGDGRAYVSWNPPSFQGGGEISAYVVTSSRGDRATVTAAQFLERGYAEVPGLANGSAYTFTVAAVNARGESPPSLPSWPVAPAPAALKPASAPARIEAHVQGARASVHFGAPADHGGSPVLGYRIWAGDKGPSALLTGRAYLVLEGAHTTFAVLDRLPAGAAVRLRAAAITAAGEGAAAESKPVAVAP